MRWQGRRTSGNVVDRRGGRGGGLAIGGVGTLALVLVGLFFGVDVTPFLTGGGGGSSYQSDPSGPNTIDDQTEEFVAVVLGDTEEVWSDIFQASDLTYTPPELVLYDGRTASACGGASAAMGPFYCPNDQRIFLDTGFFRTMQQRLGGGGDFAYAYVIAHEVAHHVQNELGTLQAVNARRANASQADANALSVRIELQADCYSGVWARAVEQKFGTLEAGDIDEALRTAAAIGDDALQRASTGTVVPDSFTHGSSEQRATWFQRGFADGDPSDCDTFDTNNL